VLALLVAVSFITTSLRLTGTTNDPRVRYAASAIGTLSLGQLGLGLLNMLMLAPVWLQICHLLVADALWIAYVLLAACMVEAHPVRRTATVAHQSTPAPVSIR